MPFYGPAGGAAGLTLEGSNTTEATSTSTSAANMSAVTSLSIAASTPILITFSFRKTSGTNGASSFGLTLNSTVVVDAGLDQNSIAHFTGSTALSGSCVIYIGPRSTNYLRALSRFYNYDSGGADTGRFDLSYNADMPTATITSVTLRGDAKNSDTTIGTSDVFVYSLATS